MKRLIWLCLIAIVGCRKGEIVLEEGYFTVGSNSTMYYCFKLTKGTKIDVDFRVTAGDSVDVLLLNKSGFKEYLEMFEPPDTVDTNIYKEENITIIPYQVKESSTPEVDSGIALSFIFFASDSCKVKVYYTVNDSMLNSWYDDTICYRWINQKKSPLKVHIYNDSKDTINYSFWLNKYHLNYKRNQFTYEEEGTQFNTSSFSYEFKAAETDSFYIVIDNRDIPVIEDAIPKGNVTYYIKITR